MLSFISYLIRLIFGVVARIYTRKNSMCARFTMFSGSKELHDVFGLQEMPSLSPRFNIAPSQPVIAIGLRADGKGYGAATFIWGFVPHWAPDTKGPKPVNAKSETLDEKSMFRDSFRKRRCIIPSTGYYEWRTEGKKKIPLFIRRRDHGIISFAGIWDCWKSSTEKLLTCAIITTSANDLTRSIHERMPVILPNENYSQWLDRDLTDSATLKSLLKPCPNELLEIIPANPVVNSSKYEGEDCIKF